MERRIATLIALIILVLVGILTLLGIEDPSTQTDVSVSTPPGGCSGLYAPVCGTDNVTYSNACFAQSANANTLCNGECPCNVSDLEVSGSTFVPSTGTYEEGESVEFVLEVNPSFEDATNTFSDKNAVSVDILVDNMLITNVEPLEGISAIGICEDNNTGKYFEFNRICVDVAQLENFSEGDDLLRVTATFQAEGLSYAFKDPLTFANQDISYFEPGVAGKYTVIPSGDQVVYCDHIDSDGDTQLALQDFTDFAGAYRVPFTCEGIEPITRCGGRDVNFDGSINLIDFTEFAGAYRKSSCAYLLGI